MGARAIKDLAAQLMTIDAWLDRCAGSSSLHPIYHAHQFANVNSKDQPTPDATMRAVLQFGDNHFGPNWGPCSR